MNSTSSHVLGAAHIRVLEPYVAGKTSDSLARELSLDQREIIKLASNENPLGMPDGARRVIERLAVDGSAMYPDPDGIALKLALSAKFGLPTTCFTLGCGSDELIHIGARAMLAKGDSAVISQYSFASYRLAIAEVNARAIVVPALHYGNHLEAMLDAMQEDTRLLYLANPNNPTGTFHPPTLIRDFLKRVPERVTVVLDEAYTEYLPDA